MVELLKRRKTVVDLLNIFVLNDITSNDKGSVELMKCYISELTDILEEIDKFESNYVTDDIPF